MPILEAKMLQKSILEPHFLHKALLEPKWDNRRLHPNHFLRFWVLQGKGQNSQKSVKSRSQNLAFFWDASWKASWRVLGAKLEPKPSKITPKMAPKEINHASKKSKILRGKRRAKTQGNQFLKPFY